MPEIQVTDEKGTTHIFPDGSTPEMIARAMNVHVQGAPEQTQQPGFWENLGHTFGIGAQEQAARQQDFQQHPVRSLAEAALGPAYQVGQSLVGGAKRIGGELLQAGQSLQQGNSAAAAVHGINAIPLVGPALNKMADQSPATAPGQSYLSKVASAATPGNVGTALGTAAQVAPMVLGAVDQAAPGRASIPNPPNPALIQKAQNYFRPPTSPSIVPRTEMAARNLSAAILPATKDASTFIKAAQAEVPNVIEYAKSTGNPLNTQLEFAKAAQGYAAEVRNFYEQEVLGPVQGEVVKTSGSGFGSKVGEGPDTYATLGEIDSRVTEINKQLDKPSLNVDDQRRALASKADLQQEASRLRDILHPSLSDHTGIPPDQIADIRQRVGRSYELANDTDAAVTARMQAAGKTDMGPIHISQIPSRAIEFTRGGVVPIADRAFQRAIKNFPGQSSNLPAVNPPVQGMPMPTRPGMAQSLGGTPTQPPMNIQMVSPDAQLNAMSSRLAARGDAVKSAKFADMSTAAQRADRLRELLASAKKLQDSAKRR